MRPQRPRKRLISPPARRCFADPPRAAFVWSAFHGYPTLIHRLTYRRRNHDNFHVRGYRDEGTTTTPFDMVVLNNLDRYQLALDAIRCIPRFVGEVQRATERYWSTMERHKLFVSEYGEDMPEVQGWRWSGARRLAGRQML